MALYAAGTGGYGSASALVASASASDQSGSFTVPAGYACPQPTSQMYLIATGGTIGSTETNPNRVLMTALGSCENLSSASVVVNEMTSVASAFATAPFAANDALNGNSSYLYLGTSSSNPSGIANAFAAVNNLVDISTGKVRFTVPAENAAVPYVEINTLADFVSACAATSGGVEGDGSACSILFTAADLLRTGTYPSSIAPADTLQAIFNIAQHPTSNYGYSLDGGTNLFTLATSNSSFQPILSTSPADWSLSLHYTGGGGLSGSSTAASLAIDASGNLWITDTKSKTVIEWNTTGAALSPATGFPAGGGPIAIAASGDVWISGDGALYELTSLGAPLPWSPYGGVSGGGSDMAIDAQSNVWITNPAGVNEFNGLGQQLSPVAGYTADDIASVNAVGIDSSNNVWVGAGPNAQYSSGQLLELSNPGGQRVTDAPGDGSASAQMAADSAGDMWYISVGGAACKAPPYQGKGSVLLPTCYSQGGTNAGGINIQNPRGIALDGAGFVWVGSRGDVTQPLLQPGVFPIDPATSTAIVSVARPYASPSLSAGSLRVAVDGSGNVWVLLGDNTVTEFVGAATPVVTPLALGSLENKFGAKP